MAIITSNQSGNWSDTATWVGGVVPGTTNGQADAVHITTDHIVTMDVAAIPAGPGTLEGIYAKTAGGDASNGKLAISLASTTKTITATNGLNAGIGTLCTPTGSGNLLTINGPVTGGSASSGTGLVLSAAVQSAVINGDAIGGSGSYCAGVASNSSSSTVINGNVIGSNTATSASGLSIGVIASATINNGNIINQLSVACGGKAPTYNPGASNYIQFGGTKFPAQLAAENIRYGTVHGDITGQCVVPAATNVAYGVAVDVSYTGTAMLTPQNVADALKLAPTAGEPAAGSAMALLADKTGNSLTAGERNAVADAILGRSISEAEATAHAKSLATVVLAIANKSNTSANQEHLTVYRTDGSTVHASIPLTIDPAAQPISGLG